MSDNVYSISEIVGTSKVGVDDAIQGAIAGLLRLCGIWTGSPSARSGVILTTNRSVTIRSH